MSGGSSVANRMNLRELMERLEEIEEEIGQDAEAWEAEVFLVSDEYQHTIGSVEVMEKPAGCPRLVIELF